MLHLFSVFVFFYMNEVHGIVVATLLPLVKMRHVLWHISHRNPVHRFVCIALVYTHCKELIKSVSNL
jgi:hypothetical protein